MPSNPFSVLADPCKFFRSLLCDIRLDEEERHVDAVRAANSFQQVPLSPEARALLIQHADAKYGERLKELEQLERKREWLATFCMGAVTFLVGARHVAARPPTGAAHLLFGVAIAAFLCALAILLLSRRVVLSQSRFSIQTLREGLAHEGMREPEDWIAASLHKTCEDIRVHQDAIAAHLNCALAFVFVALSMLLLIAIFAH